MVAVQVLLKTQQGKSTKKAVKADEVERTYVLRVSGSD